MNQVLEMLKLPKAEIEHTVIWARSGQCYERTTKKIPETNEPSVKL